MEWRLRLRHEFPEPAYVPPSPGVTGCSTLGRCSIRAPTLKLVHGRGPGRAARSRPSPFVVTSPADAVPQPADGNLSAVPYDTERPAWPISRSSSDEEIREKGPNSDRASLLPVRIGGWNDLRTRMWYVALQDRPRATNDYPGHGNAVWAALREHRERPAERTGPGAAELMTCCRRARSSSPRLVGMHCGLAAGRPRQSATTTRRTASLAGVPNGAEGQPAARGRQLLNFMLEPEVAIASQRGRTTRRRSIRPKGRPGREEEVPTLAGGSDPTGKLEHLTFAEPDYWNGQRGGVSRAVRLPSKKRLLRPHPAAADLESWRPAFPEDWRPARERRSRHPRAPGRPGGSAVRAARRGQSVRRFRRGAPHGPGRSRPAASSRCSAPPVAARRRRSG